MDSSNSGFGPEEDSAYLDGVSLPDFELLSDPEDEHLCASLMQLLQESLDSRLWPKIQGLFSSANSPFVPGFSQSLTLSTGFRVIKKKLYSSEQLLIEEC